MYGHDYDYFSDTGRNASGYPDPTAFAAIKRLDAQIARGYLTPTLEPVKRKDERKDERKENRKKCSRRCV